MRLHARLTKVDEAKRLVFGRIAEERVDKAGEVMDYAKSVPHFRAWSEAVAKDSGGKSLGNVRAMHGKVAAGKLTGIDFNDTEKAIDVCAKVVDDAEWGKVLEGVYTGFSIGGSYGDRQVEKAEDGASVTRYTAIPSEVSLVDRPCMSGAVIFDVVKADGTLVKVEASGADEAEKKDDEADESADDEKAEKADDGDDGDEDKKDDAEPAEKADGDGDLEVKGSAEDVMALGKAMNAAGLCVADLLTMLAKRDEKPAEPVSLQKALYSCASFVGAIDSLVSLRHSAEYEALMEGDPADRAIADRLGACIAMCGSVLQDMLAHELAEAAGEGPLEMAERLGELTKGHDAPLADLAAAAGFDLTKREEAPADPVLAKAEALAVERTAPLQKALDDAMKRIEKLEAQPAPTTIRLRAMEKAADVADPTAAAGAEPEPVRDAFGKVDEVATLIKSVQARGGRRIA